LKRVKEHKIAMTSKENLERKEPLTLVPASLMEELLNLTTSASEMKNYQG